jgi:quercetin dioxygenase-like cupin family protein
VELVDDAVAGRPVGQPEPWVELGAELLIDEEHIKCWIETVPPGERRPAHTHRHPWVTVVLNGASCESFGEDGRLIRARTLETGQVFHNSGAELPMRHYVHNVSDRTLTMVAIEVRGR